MDFSDKAKKTRPGEELDEGVVETFLKDAIPGLSGKCSIRQFPRGYSNLTYLVAIGDREMVLRRPPSGPISNPPTTWAVNSEFCRR